MKARAYQQVFLWSRTRCGKRRTMLDTLSVRSIISSALLGNGSRQRHRAREKEEVAHGLKQTAPNKTCAHPGCDRPVNKATARYCSIGCHAPDPAPQARRRTT